MQNYNKEEVMENWKAMFPLCESPESELLELSTALDAAFKAGRYSMREDAKGIFMTTHSNMGFLDKLEALK